jgi:predicted transcriptional regulator
MEIENVKIRLPSGKEASLIDALGFCYDISDTDFQVLRVLMKGTGKTEDELSSMLHLSKASINRSVNKLASLGFIEREKDPNSKGGRPRFIYTSISYEKLTEKITRDFKYCADIFSGSFGNEFTH